MVVFYLLRIRAELCFVAFPDPKEVEDGEEEGERSRFTKSTDMRATFKLKLVYNNLSLI